MGMKNLAKLIFPAFAGQHRDSGYDALTDVASADLFTSRAVEELKISQSSGNPMSIVVCSVDNLNEIASKYGAKSAEQAIKLISTVVRGQINDHTKLGRLANGSFVVAIANSNLQTAALKAESVRSAVSAISINGPMADHEFSVSIGVAPATADGSIVRTIESANQVARLASSQGGDRVRLSGASESRSSNNGAAEEYAARTEQLRDVA